MTDTAVIRLDHEIVRGGAKRIRQNRESSEEASITPASSSSGVGVDLSADAAKTTLVIRVSGTWKENCEPQIIVPFICIISHFAKEMIEQAVRTILSPEWDRVRQGNVTMVSEDEAHQVLFHNQHEGPARDVESRDRWIAAVLSTSIPMDRECIHRHLADLDQRVAETPILQFGQGSCTIQLSRHDQCTMTTF